MRTYVICAHLCNLTMTRPGSRFHFAGFFLDVSGFVLCSARLILLIVVAAGGQDGHLCKIFSAEDGSLQQTLSGHTNYIIGCRFLGDGEILTASGDLTAALWDVENGSKVLFLRSPFSLRQLFNFLSPSSGPRVPRTHGRAQLPRAVAHERALPHGSY